MIARFTRDQAGGTAIEFPLVVTALFLFIFGIIDMGRFFATEVLVGTAVERAARCASVTPATCSTASSIQSYASSQIYSFSVPSSDFTVDTAASCGIQVSAAVPFAFAWAGHFPSGVVINAQFCHPS